MSYIRTYFHHVQAVENAARPLGVSGVVQLSGGALQLTDGNKTETWAPKYMAKVEGRTVYVPVRGPGVTGFAGWMPYGLRQWPTATDKIAFKRYAIAHDVATPAACFDPARIGGPFIIKQADSSFGEGIRGPFLAYSPGDPDHQLAEGEYYENFVLGHIAKAWCWAGTCVALHLDPPSTVTGDGSRTVRELVSALPNNRPGENDWDLISRLAAYCAVSLDDEVPRDKEVLVEFRYASRYAVDAPDTNPNLFPQLLGSPLAAQFERAAEIFACSISPDPELRNSLYTLDAIVDSDGVAQFLELNCNPIVHPDLYGPIMRSRFARTQPQSSAHAGAGLPA